MFLLGEGVRVLCGTGWPCIGYIANDDLELLPALAKCRDYRSLLTIVRLTNFLLSFPVSWEYWR